MTDYLYHYTSVETLVKILENKTFRFSSLLTVDDMEESVTKDFGNYGRFCYVSCWTSKKEETSSLWSEYTNKKGVRIKLPTNIFPVVNEKPEIFAKNPNIIVEEKVKSNMGLIDIESTNKITFMPRVAELFPVTYTEDDLLINLNVISGNSINQSLLGRFKRKSTWEHQSEWRYKLFCLPFSLEEFYQIFSSNQLEEKILELSTHDNLPCEYFDLPVDQEKFKDMEIVLSSLLTDDEKAKVIKSVNKYNPSAKIKESSVLLRK